MLRCKYYIVMMGRDTVTPKNQNCGKCLLTGLDGKKFAENIADYISLIPEDNRTGSDEYAGRIEVCRKCSVLIEGMCGECGCFAEIRAAKIKLHCPVGKW